MAIPVFAAPAAKGTAVALGKGVTLVKGLSSAKLAKAGVATVSATKFAKGLSKKDKADIEKTAKKSGINIDFDYDIGNKISHNFRVSNKGKKSRFKLTFDIDPKLSFGFNVRPKDVENKAVNRNDANPKNKKYKVKNFKKVKSKPYKISRDSNPKNKKYSVKKVSNTNSNTKISQSKKFKAKRK